jgi:tripartite-type tricarboxylate transporter receptor subunit TctC
MINYRRTLIHGMAAAAVALIAAPATAQAPVSNWPNKPIRYIVPFAPGGTTDILARTIGERLGAAVSRSSLKTNRGKAARSEWPSWRAAPDGYTIGGGTTSSHAINATLYDKLSYDPVTSFAPITMYATQPNVLLVHPSVPVKNVRELIALLKASPNKYSFGSAGNGTSQHISGELFKAMAGVNMQHIPYRGSGQMMPELLGGTLQVAFDNIASAVQHVNAGKLRALAVTSATRSVVSPDVPTMAEAGLAGYDISAWQAVFAPAGTPAPIVERLYTEISRILKTPDIQKRFTDLGLNVSEMTPAQLSALVKSDVPRLGKIVKETGARAD